MAAAPSHHPITLPDLGIEDAAQTLSVWLVPLGAEVVAGDRIVEILAGDVVVDLSAPVTGTLIEVRVMADDPVTTDQVLGILRESP